MLLDDGAGLTLAVDDVVVSERVPVRVRVGDEVEVARQHVAELLARDRHLLERLVVVVADDHDREGALVRAGCLAMPSAVYSST